MILGQSPYPYISVETAARVLRVSPKTLYRNMAEIPHIRLGVYYRVHVSFLLFEYVLDPFTARLEASLNPGTDSDQLQFEYDVPIRTVKRYRNGELKRTGDFEVTLSKKKWRNPVVE